jgi:hypothetical protein
MQTTTATATVPARVITNVPARVRLAALAEWSRANDSGEGFAGSDTVDAMVCDRLGEGSSDILLVFEDSRVLAAAYSYGASWCVDVTSLFQAQTA